MSVLSAARAWSRTKRSLPNQKIFPMIWYLLACVLKSLMLCLFSTAEHGHLPNCFL